MDGWEFVFRLRPDEEFSEIVLHVRFHQTEARFQQESTRNHGG